MKLIFCNKCYDVFRLAHEVRSCECGKCKGKYTNGIDAVYSGGPAIPLGFANQSFVDAVDKQLSEDTLDRKGGITFTAFVIPKKCNTFTKVKKIE